MIFGVIKQIYHVWEGYLQKIPVLRLNFFVSRLVFVANTPPKHDISVQYNKNLRGFVNSFK